MDKIKYNKIAVLGKSKKFIIKIKKNYRFKQLDIIPWRQTKLFSKKMSNKYNLIFVCGFNFNLYTKDIIFFKKKNIFEILDLLKRISNKHTLIVYINTKIKNNRSHTFSRYKYAKQKLAYLINKSFKKNIIYNSDLIKEENKISINSNLSSRFIFYIFSKLKLIKTIEIKKIFLDINNLMHSKNYSKQNNIKGIFLKIPRSQFLDRLLRLIFG